MAWKGLKGLYRFPTVWASSMDKDGGGPGRDWGLCSNGYCCRIVQNGLDTLLYRKRPLRKKAGFVNSATVSKATGTPSAVIDSKTEIASNNGVQLTGNSVRSSLAPAAPSSSGLALDAKVTQEKSQENLKTGRRLFAAVEPGAITWA